MLNIKCDNGIEILYSVTKGNTIDKIYDEELTSKVKTVIDKLNNINYFENNVIETAKEMLSSPFFYIGHELMDNRLYTIPQISDTLEINARQLQEFFKWDKEIAAELDEIVTISHNITHMIEEHMPDNYKDQHHSDMENLTNHGVPVSKTVKIDINGGVGCNCNQKWEEYETSRYFKGLDFTGLHDTPQMGYKTLLWCTDSKPKVNHESSCLDDVLIAYDPRSVKEIGTQIKDATTDIIKQMLEDRKIENIHILVGKQLDKPKIDEDQEEITKEQAEMYKLTDNTIVKTSVTKSHVEGVDEELTSELQGQILNELTSNGYRIDKKECMYGCGGTGKKIMGSDYMIKEGELFIAELMEFQPQLDCRIIVP